MVQIIPAAQRKPSFAERLNVGIGRGLEHGSQLLQQNQLKQQERQKNENLQRLTGMDLSSLEPEIQKTIVSEMLKHHGKQDILGQKQKFLDQLLGGRQQESQLGNQLQGSQQQNEQKQGIPNGFDPTSLSDEDIARASAVDPNLGRSLQHAKDISLRERRAKEELEFRKSQASPEHKREQQVSSAQAVSDVKYNEKLQELSRQHELKEQTLNRLEKLNLKGVTGKPYEKLLEKAGLINLTSEGRREFAADVKNLITDIRSILGGQFSQAEFMTILNAYPSADFSKEANSAIIKNLKDFQDIKTKEVEFAQEIKKENNGKIPEDFQAKVNERVREYAQSKLPEIKKNASKIMAEEYGIKKGNVLLFDPNGEPLDVPQQDVDKYLELGAYLP